MVEVESRKESESRVEADEESREESKSRVTRGENRDENRVERLEREVEIGKRGGELRGRSVRRGGWQESSLWYYIQAACCPALPVSGACKR